MNYLAIVSPPTIYHKEKHEKYEDETKAHVFDVLPKDYNPVRVSCNVKILNMTLKDPKKDIRWFWKK